MKASEKLSISELKASFDCSNVYMGALVGPAMVAGTLATFYFMRFGCWAMILAYLALGIVGYECAVCAEIPRRYQIYDYGSYAKKMYHGNKLLCVLLEIYLVATLIVGASVVQNMAGIFVQELTGLSPMTGMIIMAVIAIVCCVFESGFVRVAGSVMSIVMLVGFIVITALILALYPDRLGAALSTWYVPEGNSILSGIWSSCLFAFMSAAMAITLCSVEEPIKKRRQSNWIGWFTLIITGTLMALNCLGFLPFVDEVMNESVPLIYVMDHYIAPTYPWIPKVYYIVMLFAIISSLIPNMYMISTRFIKWTCNEEDSKKRKGHLLLFCVLFAALCTGISSFGLLDILNYGYSFLSYAGIPLIVIPMCIVWPIKWHRERKLQSKKGELTNE